MIRRLLLYAMAGLLALVVVAAGALYWFLSNDGIRLALEQQAAAWLGQPVRIASVGAQFWPRPGLTLRNVTIGQPARLTLGEVGVSTELTALLKRRIADAAIRIGDTRMELPLPFAIPTGAGGAAAEPAAFTIESINSIALDGVRIVSRGRELAVSADSSFDGARLTIRRATVESGKTSIRAEGVVSLEPRVDATLRASANRLDVDELIALADAFGPPPAVPGAPRADAGPAGAHRGARERRDGQCGRRGGAAVRQRRAGRGRYAWRCRHSASRSSAGGTRGR